MPVRLAVLLLLMPVSGIVANLAVSFVLMMIGIHLQDNYQLFFGGSRGVAIAAISFAVGGVIPVLLLWRWLGAE